MTTSQQQLDASLGTLAATAEKTECPPQDVERMCEAADFTRGLDIGAIAGAVVGVGCAVSVTELGRLIGHVVDVGSGVGCGVPAQNVRSAAGVVEEHACLRDAALASVGSCVGAIGELTSSCATTIGSIVDEVCTLAASAVGCGVGAAASQLVQAAVTTVTGMLEQRNCGLHAIVDITVGDCAPAAACTPTEPPKSSQPSDSSVSPESLEPQQPVAAAPEPQHPVDPVHGFDKTGLIPETTQLEPTQPESPGDGWQPDIWTTGRLTQ